MRPQELTAWRCGSQLLSGPPTSDPVDVVGQLLAVQAQDPRGFRLAIRSRSVGVTSAQVDAALTVDRSLVVATLNRGTLHLVRPVDYWWLHRLTTPQLRTANHRRLDETGLDPDQADRGVDIVVSALANEGPLTRHELRTHLEAAGVPTAGQALIHVLALTGLRGLTVRGPIRHGQQAWVLVADWLGLEPVFDPDLAVAALARRFLFGHGPADHRDLARWAGVSLQVARAGLSAVASELDDLGGGLVALSGSSPRRELPPPRLLGAFDPLLLGWTDRRPIVGDAPGLITNNGLFRPFALVDGRAVASWGLSSNTLTIRPFRRLSATTRRALVGDAEAVGEYLGLVPRPVVVIEPPIG
jgi:hypothetical protein